MDKKILIIGGPTASGKSAVALSIAEAKDGVIINADSQQIYKDLRILSARPTPEEEARVPHRLYGLLPAYEACSAGKWLKFAHMEIDWVLGEGKLPIIVGGTGLYINALLKGIADMPDIAPEVRTQATNDYEAMGKEAFAARLKEINPAFFERLKVYDKQRLIRAYEIWLGSGKTLSWWQARPTKGPYPQEWFDIQLVDLPRAELYQRCNARFTAMIEQGAIDEVKHLLSLQLPDDAPIMKSVGVRELASYLRGETTLEQAIEKAQQATRNYAKRQMTWFRHQLPKTA